MSQIVKELIFEKAGKLMLTKFVNGVLTKTAANMAVRNGSVSKMKATVTVNTKAMKDGNSDWDAFEHVTGRGGKVDVTMSSVTLELLAFLIGTTVTELSNRTMASPDEPLLIPDSTPFTCSLGHSYYASGMTPIVKDQFASSWGKVASAPATGEFAVSGTVATFNSADAGKEVFITYDWLAATVQELGFAKQGNAPTLNAVIASEVVGEDEETKAYTNIVVDRCKVIGDIPLPDMDSEPQEYTFSLKVLKPRGSNKALDMFLAAG